MDRSIHETSVTARVLAVDDDAAILRFVVGALELEGYAVVAAADGLEALDLLDAQPPDVIVLDWAMPRCDGPELVRRYRARPGRHAPIALMTAAANAQERCDQLRVQGCLPKPFDLDELVETVDRLAGRAA